MKQPDKEYIEHWLEVADEHIKYFDKEIDAGIIDQATCSTLSLFYAQRGRTLFLRGDPLTDVRRDFRKAVEMREQSFSMAFDEQSPHYVGNTDKVKWGWADEVCAVYMMSWALISADFDYAAQVAKWPRPTLDNDPARMEVSNYVYGLRDALLGELSSAEEYLAHTLAKYATRAPVKNDVRRNYYTLSKTLMGILREDQLMFTEGLEEQLNFYRSYARYEAKDTDEEFFCDNAVALANLAIKQGLTVEIESQYLPLGVLIQN